MKAVLLSPHNDDAELFACFTLLRERPDVVVCLRSFTQGKNYARRELETAAAMQVLGCAWTQWPFPDNAPDWPAIRREISLLAERYDHCYAPWPRYSMNGHTPDRVPPLGCGVCQHDKIGDIAREVFGEDRYTGYLTYTREGGKDTFGHGVEYESDWPLLKLKALICYPSQIARADTAPHFLRDLEEYYAAGPPA